MKTSSLLAALAISFGTLGAPAPARAEGPPPAGQAAPLPPAGQVAPPPPPGWTAPPPGWVPAPPPWAQQPYPPGSWGPGSYPPPWSPDKPKRSWYGWQILIPGLVSDTLVYAAPFLFDYNGLTVALAVGMVGHAVSGPIVHLAHGHPLRALGSFALEAGLPGAMLGLGLALPCSNDGCTANWAVLLIGVPSALITSLVVDSVVLAREEPEPPLRASGWTSSLGLAPQLTQPLRAGSGGAHALSAPSGVALTGKF